MQPALISVLIHLLLTIGIVVVLVNVAFNVWLSYIQTVFLKGIKWSMLEVKPPKDVFKSPFAMELVLNSLHVGGQGGDWVTRYWKGEVSLWHSLEIVSTEGAVHFYIRTPDKFKKIIQTQIYAQYPQAEILEVQDYVNNAPAYGKDSAGLWGGLLKLTKDDVYPIKTYVDYGLDKAVGSLEEEQRIDPITPLIEFLGSIGLGEHAWMQILIRQDTKRFKVKNKDGVEELNKSWLDKAKDTIKELNNKLVEKDEEGKKTARRATKGEQAVVEAIERNATKYGFDSIIRVIYMADKDHYNPNNIGGFLGSVRQFNSNDLNGFKPDGTPKVDFPWQDMFGKKVEKIKTRLLSAYKARKYFYGSFDFSKFGSYFTHPNKSGKTPYILSTEELATIFHLPGRVAETPTFTRIEAKKGEPPANLPM